MDFETPSQFDGTAHGHSVGIAQARSIIESVRGQHLSAETRVERAVQLAEVLLEEAHRSRTSSDRALEVRLSRLMEDHQGKAFTTALTDQCFRSENRSRVADQLRYLVDSFGVPVFLRWWERLGLRLLS